MTSSLSSAHEKQTSMWGSMLPYVTPPFVAAIAVIPVFWCFIFKAHLQLGKSLPPMTLRQAVKEGVGVSPTTALLVGTQVIAINVLAKWVCQNDQNGKATMLSSMGSTVAVAGLSVPMLAVFSGRANNLGARDSLKRLNKAQACTLLGREISFLGSLSLSAPGSEAMKRYFGESKAMEYVSTMMIGLIGSLAGHPADTCFTRLQDGQSIGMSLYPKKGLSVKDWCKTVIPLLYQDTKSLYKGGLIRAVGVSGFNAVYKAVNELIGN